MDWARTGIGVGVAVVVLVFATLFALVGITIYFAATGGTNYTDHRKVDGVECIVIRDRLTNNVRSVSCPPIQP